MKGLRFSQAEHDVIFGKSLVMTQSGQRIVRNDHAVHDGSKRSGVHGYVQL